MDGAPPAEDDQLDSVRRHEVTADIGRLALETDDLDQVLREASVAVADALGTDFCMVLERLPGGNEARIRAGTGWQKGLVGSATIPTDGDSHAGAAVSADGPVVADDIRTDEPFSGAELLTDHGVISGIGVVIDPGDEPWGVLGAYATEPRSFSDRDANFIRSVANTLAMAVEAGTPGRRTEEARPLRERIVETVTDGMYALDDLNRFVLVNDTFCELTGYPRETLLGAHSSLVYGDEVTERATKLAEAATADDGEAVVLEVDLQTADGETIPVESRFVPYEYREGRLGLTGVVRDITESKRFEEAITALHDTSRELFRATSEDDVAALVVDAGTDVLDFTDVALYLYDADRDELYPAANAINPGFMWEELPRVPPDGSTLVGHAFATGESHIEDDIRESPHFIDEETDMRAGVYAPVGEYGALFAGSTTIGAFDERSRRTLELLAKNAETAFDRLERERELEHYETIVETIPDGAYVCDEDQCFRFVNDGLVELTGYSREQLVGSHISLFGTEEGVEQSRRLREELLNGEREMGTITNVIRTADGETIPAETRFTLLPVGRGFRGTAGIIRDITKRKEYEQRLEESERRYRTLAEHFPNGAVGVFDGDLRYTLTEGAVLDETLPSADRLEGNRMPEIFPEETVVNLEPLFRAAVDDGETASTTTEFGGRHWRVWATPLRDADGEIFAGLSFAQDITERIEREHRLERLVDQLEASNERLEQFAYAASHDLQEPLRMVSSYLQLIEDRYADALDEDGAEFLDFAVDGAERMQEMITSLLEYSRVETQGDPFEAVDLNAVLDDVREVLQVRIEESGAEITTEPLPTVDADRGQLRQVFQNLLSNAIEYSGDAPPKVHVSAERRGSDWIISVEDDGIGIEPSDQDLIFAVFQRLHSRQEHPGTGIGLALCERIVERHGGDIWVESESGEGATFSFSLADTTDHDA